MSPVSSRPAGPVARSLSEAIETVVTPRVRDVVLTRALGRAAIDAVPERGPEVFEFVEGPLLAELGARIGEDVAAELLEQLRPVLVRAALRASAIPAVRRAASSPAQAFPSVRPTRVSSPPKSFPSIRPGPGRLTPRPSRPPLELDLGEYEADDDSGFFVSARSITGPLPRAALRTVLLASTDARAATAFALLLSGRAIVRTVDSLLDVVDALEEPSDVRPTVVLDLGAPSFQLHSLIAMSPELPADPRIVVWRWTEEHRPLIVSARPATKDWIVTAARTLEQLALEVAPVMV